MEDTESIEGIVALATDDLLHGGSQRHLERMETLRKRYTLGKYTWGQGRFVGKDFTPLSDGSIRIDQEFYVKARVQEIQIAKDRKRRKYSQCTPLEVELLRTLLGTLAWVAKETRADLAGKVALVQQFFPRPLIRDLLMANLIPKQALTKPQPAWGNAREFGQYLEDSKVDWWEEQPGRWIRHHHVPRITSFHPAAAPDGPDLHDLLPDRHTEIQINDTKNLLQDEWTSSSSITSLTPSPWTGKTIFKKQPQGHCLEAKLIHGGYDYEQLLKLYSQGGEITFFYDRARPLTSRSSSRRSTR